MAVAGIFALHPSIAYFGLMAMGVISILLGFRAHCENPMDRPQTQESNRPTIRQMEYLCDSLLSFKPRERSKARELLIAIGEPAIVPLIANLREHHTAWARGQ